MKLAQTFKINFLRVKNNNSITKSMVVLSKYAALQTDQSIFIFTRNNHYFYKCLFTTVSLNVLHGVGYQLSFFSHRSIQKGSV